MANSIHHQHEDCCHEYEHRHEHMSIVMSMNITKNIV